MSNGAGQSARALWLCVLGFACNQGFIYALFYIEPKQSLFLGDFAFERVDLLGTLLFMCLSFYAIATLPPRIRQIALAPRFALAYASILVLGAGIPGFVGQQDLVSIAYESICVGIPASLMLCAWGKALGAYPASFSVPVACVGMAMGAAICLVVSVIPVEGFYAILYFAPLGSAMLLRSVQASTHSDPLSSSRQVAAVVLPSDDGEETRSLSVKILLGTATFGIATGIVEVVVSESGMAAAPAFSVTLFFFVLFCLASMQLSWGRSLIGERWKASDRSASQTSDSANEIPLSAIYRLATLIIMSGFLLTPILGGYGVPGEAIVLTGYLGITVVLISMFLVMAYVSSRDTAKSFAYGFGFLFGGELCGIILGNMVSASGFSGDVRFLLVAAGGIVVLISYLYLFTSRDMEALSHAVEEVDYFDEALRVIASDAGLSKREVEILPFALRGRTGERIASELFISKNTVETHLRHIYAKCGVRGKQELIDLGERTEREIRNTLSNRRREPRDREEGGQL